MDLADKTFPAEAPKLSWQIKAFLFLRF